MWKRQHSSLWSYRASGPQNVYLKVKRYWIFLFVCLRKGVRSEDLSINIIFLGYFHSAEMTAAYTNKQNQSSILGLMARVRRPH